MHTHAYTHVHTHTHIAFFYVYCFFAVEHIDDNNVLCKFTISITANRVELEAALLANCLHYLSSNVAIVVCWYCCHVASFVCYHRELEKKACVANCISFYKRNG